MREFPIRIREELGFNLISLGIARDRSVRDRLVALTGIHPYLNSAEFTNRLGQESTQYDESNLSRTSRSLLNTELLDILKNNFEATRIDAPAAVAYLGLFSRQPNEKIREQVRALSFEETEMLVQIISEALYFSTQVAAESKRVFPNPSGDIYHSCLDQYARRCIQRIISAFDDELDSSEFGKVINMFHAQLMPIVDNDLSRNLAAHERLPFDINIPNKNMYEGWFFRLFASSNLAQLEKKGPLKALIGVSLLGSTPKNYPTKDYSDIDFAILVDSKMLEEEETSLQELVNALDLRLERKIDKYFDDRKKDRTHVLSKGDFDTYPDNIEETREPAIIRDYWVCSVQDDSIVESLGMRITGDQYSTKTTVPFEWPMNSARFIPHLYVSGDIDRIERITKNAFEMLGEMTDQHQVEINLRRAMHATGLKSISRDGCPTDEHFDNHLIEARLLRNLLLQTP